MSILHSAARYWLAFCNNSRGSQPWRFPPITQDRAAPPGGSKKDPTWTLTCGSKPSRSRKHVPISNTSYLAGQLTLGFTNATSPRRRCGCRFELATEFTGLAVVLRQRRANRHVDHLEQGNNCQFNCGKSALRLPICTWR